MGTLATVRIEQPEGDTGQVVTIFREVLESVVNQKAVACALVTVNADGSVGSAHWQNGKYFQLLGGLAELQYRMQNETLDAE